jgi:hypothetical protein
LLQEWIATSLGKSALQKVTLPVGRLGPSDKAIDKVGMVTSSSNLLYRFASNLKRTMRANSSLCGKAFKSASKNSFISGPVSFSNGMDYPPSSSIKL